MRTEKNSGYRFRTSIRWLARSIALFIILFWGFFVFMHLFGSEEPSAQPLDADDRIAFVAMGIWFVGLLLSFKWELVGGTTTLAGYAGLVIINQATLQMPFTLIGIAGLLFILSWWIHRPSPSSYAPNAGSSDS